MVLKQGPIFKNAVSKQSLRGLDCLCLLLADIEGGIGPYLAVHLKSDRGWDAGSIGLAIATSQIATMLAQGPAGALVDATHRKRLLVVVASLGVAIGCIWLFMDSTFALVLTAQALIGVSAAALPPLISALSLGLVGQASLDKRIGRNEMFNHAGNLLGAFSAAAIGSFFPTRYIFCLMAGFGIGSGISAMFIRANEISYAAARGGMHDVDHHLEPIGLRQLFSDPRITIFAMSLFLFAFGNAAMLPQLSQKIAETHLINPALVIAACIVLAQMTMVPTAYLSRRYVGILGRKPVLLFGFCLLPLRGLLFSLISNPWLLILIEILDGISGGIMGVTWVLVAADITRGTGRFNLIQGLMMSAISVGSGLGNILSGFVAKLAGYDMAFIVLGSIGACASLFLWLLMPETLKPQDDQ